MDGTSRRNRVRVGPGCGRDGFQATRVAASVDADAAGEALETWMDEVAERCPVAGNHRNTSELELTVEHA